MRIAIFGTMAIGMVAVGTLATGTPLRSRLWWPRIEAAVLPAGWLPCRIAGYQRLLVVFPPGSGLIQVAATGITSSTGVRVSPEHFPELVGNRKILETLLDISGRLRR
jgi:hypothetical protein